MIYPEGMSEIDIAKVKLLGSLETFTCTFFKIRTGHDYRISEPIGRPSHDKIIFDALMRVFNGKCRRLIINVPPRYGKTEKMINFMAWALANYPDSNFIYTSYAHSLAAVQTQAVRDILNLSEYRAFFGVGVDKDTGAKDDFRTTHGGRVFAAGTGGPITGRGSGIKGVKRFGGCTIIDDSIKPADASSDTVRSSCNEWFFNTLQSRCNDPENTPIVGIGQSLHEDDLFENLKKQKNKDGSPVWEIISLQALDDAGNALDPAMHTVDMLLQMQEESPYVFAAQYQQNPLPAGGAIFQKDWFPVMTVEPDIISTFLTVDTAESSKDYADFSVFSFWGIYKIKIGGSETGLYGLHWLDCRDVKIEPKDLESEFYDFYTSCMRHRVKPSVTAIERKSTGVTLSSVLSTVPGLRILNIERTAAGGSKAARFLECQRYVAQKRISFTEGAKHTDKCIQHCSKITANDSHRYDDIADTMQAAIQCALIEETLLPKTGSEDAVMKAMTDRMNYLGNLRRQAL